MKISIDIEDKIRTIISAKLTNVYVRPLPEKFCTPCILIQQVGGRQTTDWSGRPHLDIFEIVLDSRAETEADALFLLRKTIGILKETNELRFVEINTHGSWGTDPVRPDLAMCSARLSVGASLIDMEV